jgi:hypothetical protein
VADAPAILKVSDRALHTSASQALSLTSDTLLARILSFTFDVRLKYEYIHLVQGEKRGAETRPGRDLKWSHP